MSSRIGLSSRFARSNASADHAYHCTGWCAAERKYALGSFAKRFSLMTRQCRPNLSISVRGFGLGALFDEVQAEVGQQRIQVAALLLVHAELQALDNRGVRLERQPAVRPGRAT